MNQQMPPLNASGARLHHGAAWALASQGSAIAVQAAIIILLAKLGSASVVGQYSLALAIVAPVALLTRLQLRSVLATDVEREQRFGHYVALRLILNLVTIGAVALIVAGLSYDADFKYLVLALALSKAVEHSSDVYLGRLQAGEDWRRITIASVAKACCGLSAFLAVWLGGGGLALSVLAFSVGQLAVLCCYELPAVRDVLRRTRESIWPAWNWASVSRLAATTLPLGFVSMLVSLVLQAPRYFVEAYEGTEALGYWSAVVQLATVTSVLLQPLGQASLARLASYDRAHPGRYRRLFAVLIAAAVLTGAAGVAGAYLFGGWALRLIYRPEYETLQPVLVVLMGGMLVTNVCTVLGYAMTAGRRFRSQLALFGVTAAASVLSCWLLLPGYGLMGAAYAHAATWLVACVGGAVILVRHRRERGNRPAVAKAALAFVANDNPLA